MSKVENLPSIRGPEDMDPSDFDTQQAWDDYSAWLDAHMNQEHGDYLEERSMLEPNAQMADRCAREGWLEERSMVVNIRFDQYGRRYVEAIEPTHGRTELVLSHELHYIRKAKLD